jgi:hypothetical protein
LIESNTLSTDADVYWEPFKLACESKQSKIMEAALHALHYLIGTCVYVCVYACMCCYYAFMNADRAGKAIVELLVSNSMCMANTLCAEYRYLRGAKRLEQADSKQADGKTAERRTLMDEIIRTVCDCSTEQDEGVELQVIKVSANPHAAGRFIWTMCKFFDLTTQVRRCYLQPSHPRIAKCTRAVCSNQ